MQANSTTRKYTLFFTLFLATVFKSYGQQTDAKALDSLFATYDKNELFFVNVLLKKDGQTLYQGEAGYQNLETQVKNSPQTQFLIGSITKTYMAVLIMQLAEEGKLALDNKLAAYFPFVPNADRITIEMLLRHRSGLFNYTSDPEFPQKVSAPITKAQFLDNCKNLKIDFTPDSIYAYSNTNYMLLGFILEKVTGDTFENQLQKRIVVPLGLKATRLGRPSDRMHFAKSYVDNGEKWLPAQPEWDMSWVGAAGGICATAADVALFYEGLFNGKLVSEESLSKMTTLKDGYGFGLLTFPFGDRRFYGHTGGIESYRSVVGYNAEDKVLFVRLVNASKYIDPNEISIQVLNAAYGYPVQFPDLPGKLVKIDPEVLAGYAGTYAAPGFPLEIRIFLKEGRLFGQATGQDEFLLTPYSDTDFRFDTAKIEISFFRKENNPAFHFTQGTYKFDFVRKQ